ncbi:PaaI family thioesterase [Streptomyces sp. ODS05-4]|uniref:PaaI family thioesterase n=1 Tax=Streptomyces sp. ODS05-4 TaxID=2944939 RepID=UPI0021096BA3|nr:PaaI family thioesterase [Streptomyces sp. ODS05-4]
MTSVPDLAQAREILAAQPFSDLLGARLVSFGAGEATLELPIRARLHQQHGFVHGGVLSYAADNALTFAAGTVGVGRPLTAGFAIDYLRPATGEILRARAAVIRAGRTRVVCRCDVATIDGDGVETLCAVAQGTVSFALPPDAGAPPVAGGW